MGAWQPAKSTTPRTAAALPSSTSTTEQRSRIGRAARAAVPRSAHAEWVPGPDRADPTALLTGQETTRVPELVPLRHERMLASPFTFYRGAAIIMAADLAASPNTGLRVQACGDAHLSNFGGFAAPDRATMFDINDFDETSPGPFEWDVKRLARELRDRGPFPFLLDEGGPWTSSLGS